MQQHVVHDERSVCQLCGSACSGCGSAQSKKAYHLQGPSSSGMRTKIHVCQAHCFKGGKSSYRHTNGVSIQVNYTNLQHSRTVLFIVNKYHSEPKIQLQIIFLKPNLFLIILICSVSSNHLIISSSLKLLTFDSSKLLIMSNRNTVH